MTEYQEARFEEWYERGRHPNNEFLHSVSKNAWAAAIASIEEIRDICGNPMPIRAYIATHLNMRDVEINDLGEAEKFMGRPYPVDGLADKLQWQAEMLAKVRVAHADALLRELAEGKDE